MIKIIKPGTRQKLECNNCGCLFSYEAEDVKWDATKKEYFLLCPQCGAGLTVNKAKEWSPEPLDNGTGLNEWRRYIKDENNSD